MSASARTLCQRGVSPRLGCRSPEIESNRFIARWGGKQLEVNQQSVG